MRSAPQCAIFRCAMSQKIESRNCVPVDADFDDPFRPYEPQSFYEQHRDTFRFSRPIYLARMRLVLPPFFPLQVLERRCQSVHSFGFGIPTPDSRNNAGTLRVPFPFLLCFSVPSRACKFLKFHIKVLCHGRGRGFESRRPRHSFQAIEESLAFLPKGTRY